MGMKREEKMRLRQARVFLVGVLMFLLVSASATNGVASDQNGGDGSAHAATTTPVKHLVVIFQENVSFDHYFGTYPRAANPAGQPGFTPRVGTPSVNGLSEALLTRNPNLSNPQRLDRSEALTCDQNHGYTAEQSAQDHGALDKFVQFLSATNADGTPKTRAQCDVPARPGPTPNDYAVMDYYDGNTVTALWNYAQHFAMSDNSFGTTFGPSTPGALNLVTGNTYPATCGQDAAAGQVGSGDPNVYDATGGVKPCPGGVATSASSPAGSGAGTVISDPDPYYDACSNPKITTALGGRNVGNLLDDRKLSWGFFQGGFSSPEYKPGQPASFDPATICQGAHYNIGAGPANDGKPCVRHSPAQPIDAFCVTDYSAHHQPFQYFASTSNLEHLPPGSVASIGRSDQANHQYDLADFWAAVDHGSMPAVSYLKAAKYQDGHPGYSDPLDEQHFLVETINRLQRRPEWRSTAVVIAYDDSDGWYDHVMGPVYTQSQTAVDTLTNPGQCGSSPSRVPVGDDGKPQQARCGLGPRVPLLVVSDLARGDYVDHSITDQASILRFVEDNWRLGRIGNGSSDAWTGTLTAMFDFRADSRAGKLYLDPVTGQPRQEEAGG
jgi:phospholipase C